MNAQVGQAGDGKDGAEHNPCPADISRLSGRKLLEVIVTSAAEAREAEAGGADRLEVVRALEEDGLTPPLSVVQDILSSTAIPVRVMLRDVDSMSAGDQAQLESLSRAAECFGQLPVDGLVLGFVRNGEIEQDALRLLLSIAPTLKATFHRAFEHVQAPVAALDILKTFPQIDRILVRVSDSGDAVPLADLQAWQRAAVPQIRFIAGIGMNWSLLQALRNDPSIEEIHAGRIVREPATPWGAVSQEKVARLKSVLL